MVINIDLNSIRKYWLTISAAAIGIWSYMTPAAQAQLIHYVTVATLGHPILAAALAVIIADLKQSPIVPPTPAPAPTPVSTATSTLTLSTGSLDSNTNITK
jgi:hypothetical protein